MTESEWSCQYGNGRLDVILQTLLTISNQQKKSEQEFHAAFFKNRDTLTYVTFLIQFMNVILVFALLQHFDLTTNFEPIVTTAYWNPVLSGTWKQVLLPHHLCSWLCKCLCSADSAHYQPLVP